MTRVYKSISYMSKSAVLLILISCVANADTTTTPLNFFDNEKNLELSNISYHGMGGQSRSKKNKRDREIRILKHSLRNIEFQECILEILINKSNDPDASLLSITKASNGNKIELKKISRVDYQSCKSNK